MKVRLFVLAAIALLLAACGGGSSSGSAEEFCQQAEALENQTLTGDIDVSDDPEAFEEALGIFDDLADAAPSEISADMDLFQEVLSSFAAVAGADEDDPAAAFAVLGTLFERADEIEAASSRIETFLSEECGLESDAFDTDLSLGGDGDTDLFGGGATSYGDDPGLDALQDSCAAGDLDACDELYITSPFGSEYEAFGSTCGETTTETFGNCSLPQAGSDDDASDEAETITDNPSDAMSYGDDPALDALWDSCAAGDLDTCDTLYLTSPFGSDYEAFGSTCGETQGDTFGRCSAPVSAGGSYGDDPALDLLWDDCAVGLLDACDELYLTSGFGSEYEAFGSTCGETSAETFGNCADAGREAAMSYGDDPVLDELYDSCRLGDLINCDELYFVSAIGSEYEAFGSSCGGTTEPTFGNCASGDSDANDYGDDPGLDALWDACEGGDGVACDDLYFTSPIGSVYEEFGSTCGGRFEPFEVFCEDELGAG
ncbi:MAG: hypothetical protein AAGA99_17800 [Actinomycetota bacterium]